LFFWSLVPSFFTARFSSPAERHLLTPPTLWIAVAVRIAANPLSNVVQKLLVGRGVEPAGVICGAHLLLAAGTAALLPRLDRPALEFWPMIVVAAILAVAANTLITAAMHLSDLSVLGPINAYKAVVSLVPGFALLGEVPSVAGFVGIGAIIAGSYLLVEPARGGGRATGAAAPAGNRGVRLRVAALVLSAVEAVFLKRALAAASPETTFVWWSIFGLVGAAAVRLWQRGVAADAAALARHAGLYVALAVTTGLMQYTTLVTLEGLQVGYALALFQTSAVLSVLLGRWIFQETGFWRRLAGSIVMASGAALIVVDSAKS
jgi:drug/metabolite transporter (DMT)-like permease